MFPTCVARMTRPAPSTVRRISLTLDPALVIERMILARIDTLSRPRARDWLRSLLAQGFVAEGRWLHTELLNGNGSVTRIPTTAYTRMLGKSDRKPTRAPTVEHPVIDVAQTPVGRSHKPFARLRNVIG